MTNPSHTLLTPARQERFWRKVAVKTAEECWLWQGASTGYGVFRVGPKNRQATHLSLEMSGRPQPAPPFNHALHSDNCTSRLCVNPAHLRWGSHQMNMADRKRMGRTACGTKQGLVRVDEAIVRAIRSSPLNHTEAGAAFGIDRTTVSQIRRRKTWRHVD